MKNLRMLPSTGNGEKKLSFVLLNETGTSVGYLVAPSVSGEKDWRYTITTSHTMTDGVEPTADRARARASQVYNDIIRLN